MYNPSIVKVKIVVDGVIKYCHPHFDDLNALEPGDYTKYDLEEYTVPALIRKVLKTTKQMEVVELRTTRREKCIPHFHDEAFNKEHFPEGCKDIVITFALIAHE